MHAQLRTPGYFLRLVPRLGTDGTGALTAQAAAAAAAAGLSPLPAPAPQGSLAWQPAEAALWAAAAVSKDCVRVVYQQLVFVGGVHDRIAAQQALLGLVLALLNALLVSGDPLLRSHPLLLKVECSKRARE